MGVGVGLGLRLGLLGIGSWAWELFSTGSFGGVSCCADTLLCCHASHERVVAELLGKKGRVINYGQK